MKICKRCIMDTTDPDIVFDERGICNHCKKYEYEEKYLLKGRTRDAKLKNIIKTIKNEGKGRDYDCLAGVSGGVDSSYVAYLAKKFKLRTLLMHLDNGWNTKIGVKNIKTIIDKTGFGIYNYIVDWNEIRDLQLAYLNASVIDIEVVTDHAINASLYKVAKEKNIKYILKGSNIVTEIIMPEKWGYKKLDLRNLKAIHKKYGIVELKTYPTTTIFKILCLKIFRGIEAVSLLNFVDYNKAKAKKILHDEWGWEDYGGKHYESLFTRFYQAYILPTKFGVDKRKAHLSTLINSGQISREEAIRELKKPLYSKSELNKDKKKVLEKLEISETEFERFMSLKIKSHEEYSTDIWNYRMFYILKKISRIGQKRK